ncbi:MAG: pilus assembly protein [Rhodospirillaceae bacterium]|nr:pilus assembly protein [Rhodospirillaceae bacterium]
MGSGKVNTVRGRVRRRLARLVRSERGVTAVEFALIAPVCFTLVCVFIDLCMIMFITNVMEGGLREASRYAITGAVDNGTTREDKIKAIVVEHSYNLIDPADITIAYKVYPSFNDVGQPEPFVDKNGNGKYDVGESYTDVNKNGQWDADMGAAGVGGPGDIVAYIVTYKWTLWTPLAKQVWGGDGSITLSATVAVRNEPY